MKHLIIIPFLFFILNFSGRAQAALPVIDYSSVAVTLQTAKTDLVSQLIQEGNQQLQILRMVEQIKLIDRYLDRFGDPEDVALNTLKELYGLIEELPLSDNLREFADLIEDGYLYKEQSQAVYKTISKDIIVDGIKIGEHNESAFTPQLVARKGFERYHQTKSDALVRYDELKQQLQSALTELKNAKTSSEVQKLQVIVEGLTTLISETSREIDLAATDAQTRYYQNAVEEKIEEKAKAQAQRAAFEAGVKRNLEIYRFPNAPVLFKK